MFQPLIDILSALLTPVVAVAALYLGYRQYKIERFMAKQALYSRRLAIYMTTTSYARGLAYDSRHNLDAELAMRAAASEASFLLPRQVASAVKEVLDRGVNIRVNQSLIPDSPPDDE